MAAGNSNNSNATYYKLKAKSSDTDNTPYFGRNEKVNDVWTIVEKNTWVSGHLSDIKHETYDYEGAKKHKVAFTLIDPDGSKTIVEANYNNLTYGILNALASFSPQEIKIEVWLGQAKIENGREGKRYPSAAIKVEGNTLLIHSPSRPKKFIRARPLRTIQTWLSSGRMLLKLRSSRA